jgi:hypothetical protein
MRILSLGVFSTKKLHLKHGNSDIHVALPAPPRRSASGDGNAFCHSPTKVNLIREEDVLIREEDALIREEDALI